ncbi:hypothetical protein [Hydrogenophaga sp. RWCD_12]|uniref:hypothetical protein n=1 Tax=Hydrogenophaga sp. RWCD_12 TaxID=3391190 RepID=UPI0039853F56
MRSDWIALLLAAAPVFANAASWTVCDLTIQTRAREENGIRAVIVGVRKTNPSTCPKAGAELGFAPETPDYQQVLPRQRWPKPGQRSRLRYRELDGWCKNDGAQGACTIRHYSIL